MSASKEATMSLGLPNPQSMPLLSTASLSSSSLSSVDTQGDEQSIRSRTTTNPLMDSISSSKTIELFSRVKEMQEAGQAVVNLCLGEPDYPPPAAVRDAVMNAVCKGETRYTHVTGTLALRKAIQEDLLERKKVNYDVNQIIVTNGAKQAIFEGILATVGVGDEVVVPGPFWPSYPEMVKLAGATPVIVPTAANDGFLLSPQQLRETLLSHQKAKLVILCNPSNPTGAVYPYDHLQKLCAVLEEFPHVWVLSDEIYERIVYDKQECPSLASFPGFRERTLTVNGFSKAYSMTGLRLGYLATAVDALKVVSKIQSQLTSCASSISQAAGVAALKDVSDQELRDNVNKLCEKRDFVLKELSSMPGVEVATKPQGAFYVLPDVSSYFNGNDVKFCMELLDRDQLALVPGSSFGAPGTVRISYATSFDELELAMSKLRSFINQVPS